MRALKILTVAMGLMIVAATTVLAVLIIQRLGARSTTTIPTPTATTLAEPRGTHITTIAPLGPNLAVLLQGGGPDRILLLDAHLHPTTRATLPNRD